MLALEIKSLTISPGENKTFYFITTEDHILISVPSLNWAYRWYLTDSEVGGKKKLFHSLRRALKRPWVKNECGFEIIQTLTNEVYDCLSKRLFQ